MTLPSDGEAGAGTEAEVQSPVPSASPAKRNNFRGGPLVFLGAIGVAFWRHGWTGASVMLRLYASVVIVSLLLVAAVVVGGWLAKRWSKGMTATVAGACLVVWVALGSDDFIRDALGMACGAICGLMIQPGVRKKLKGGGGAEPLWSRFVALPHRAHALAIVMAWLGFGAADWLMFRPLPMDVARLKERSAPNAELGDVRVGLCLSGGGYRAALLHSGVVAQLEDFRVPIHCISSVSGGSIFSSYYTHGGAPAGFVKAVVEGRFNVKRRLLLPQNLVRLPMPLTVPLTGIPLLKDNGFSRRDVQADLLDLLYLREQPLRCSDATMAENDDKGIPRLVIGTTDLMRGWQVGMSREGYMVCGVRESVRMLAADSKKFEDQNPSMATAVSISGAFPGAFPAEPFTLKRSGMFSPDTHVRMLLADGGIHDNSGYRLMKAVRDESRSDGPGSLSPGGWNQQWDADLILVSNGGQMFDLAEVDGAQNELGRVIGLLSDLPASRQEEEFRRGPYRWKDDPVGDTIFLSPGLVTGSPDDWLNPGYEDEAEARETIGRMVQDYFFRRESAGVSRLLSSAFDGPKDEDFHEARRLLLAIHPDQRAVRNALKRVADLKEPPAAPVRPPGGQPSAPASSGEVSPDAAKPEVTVDASDIALAESLIYLSTLRRDREEALAWLVTTDMADCVKAFRRTGTLDDQVDADVGKKIHRLGRYLVILQWPEMRARAPRLLEERKKREARAAEAAEGVKQGATRSSGERKAETKAEPSSEAEPARESMREQ